MIRKQCDFYDNNYRGQVSLEIFYRSDLFPNPISQISTMPFHMGGHTGDKLETSVTDTEIAFATTTKRH